MVSTEGKGYVHVPRVDSDSVRVRVVNVLQADHGVLAHRLDVADESEVPLVRSSADLRVAHSPLRRSLPTALLLLPLRPGGQESMGLRRVDTYVLSAYIVQSTIPSDIPLSVTPKFVPPVCSGVSTGDSTTLDLPHFLATAVHRPLVVSGTPSPINRTRSPCPWSPAPVSRLPLSNPGRPRHPSRPPPSTLCHRASCLTPPTLGRVMEGRLT